MQINKILVFIFTLFLLLSSCIKEESENEATVNHIKVNDQIPPFEVIDTTGSIFNSQQFTDKQSLLIFFGTYCPDCKKVLPVIEEVWKGMKNDPEFLLIPIARKETAETVSNYWKDNQFTMPFYLDPNRADPDLSVFSLFANNTIPRIYIINKHSTVVWMAIESLDLSPEELIEKIKGTK